MESYETLNILEAQIRQCFGRVVWTHKTQEKCADMLNRRNNVFKVWQIVLSAITTSGVFVSIFGDCKIIGIITSIISLALLVLNAYLKKYDLGQIAQKHADCATDLWNIREDYLSLLTDMKANILTVPEIVSKRDELQASLHNLYMGAPRSISKAYDEASKKLKEKEELTLSDNEIDMFLPDELKRKPIHNE